eukprot:6210565-Pleurochrysis_carterae.AAC.1
MHVECWKRSTRKHWQMNTCRTHGEKRRSNQDLRDSIWQSGLGRDGTGAEGPIESGSKRSTLLLYADDGTILTDSIHTLQLAMVVMWVMTKILGLKMQIKGKKKKAWSGVYYNEEGLESDISGWE